MEVMIYGNGESRKQFDKLRFMGNYTTWGCNAIYRDLNVDNLVSVDYAMQQEIYESGYVRDNVCYFTDWSIIPNADEMLLKTMKMDFEPHMIHETLQIDRTDCVIQGKDPKTSENNIKEALDKNPDLDYNDLKLKAEKDTGLYVTWVAEDKVKNVEIISPPNIVEPTASLDPSPAPGPMFPTTKGIIAIIVLNEVIIIGLNLRSHASLTAFSIFLPVVLN